MRRQVATAPSSFHNERTAAKQWPHLFARLVALALAVTVCFVAERALIHLEHVTIVATAPENFALKKQGVAFQRAATHARNVFPIYGSSELLVPESPARGNNFFRTAPTGFQLSPVGGAGTTPLIKHPRRFRRWKLFLSSPD